MVKVPEEGPLDVVPKADVVQDVEDLVHSKYALADGLNESITSLEVYSSVYSTVVWR